MPFTIANSFAQLRQNLEITGLQAATVSTRQKNVRGVVAAALEVKDDFLAGSYMRNTLIPPLKEADIDIFIILDPKYFHNYNKGQNGGQRGLLDLLKRTLKKTYTSTPDISRNGQAVTIRFTDFVVDVVPGFNRKGGGYLIPNCVTQTWISTNPKKHIEIFSGSNKEHGGDLIPIIKMIKAWNKNNNKYFQSFHLEVLALQIFQGVKISDFPSGLRYFFDKGRTLISKQNLDPAGYGGDVGSYINTTEKIEEATRRFQVAYDRALNAEDYASKGNIRAAVDLWIKIFGDYFPSYG